MAKKYRLLKDLLIGGLDNELLTPVPVGTVFHRHDGRYECDMVNNRKPCVGATFVENNPTWFEEIKEKERIEVSEPFVVNNVTLGHIPIMGKKYESYGFQISKTIPPEKYPLIKKAIEKVLNDEDEYTFLDGFKKLHQAYIDRATEDAVFLKQDAAQQLLSEKSKK